MSYWTRAEEKGRGAGEGKERARAEPVSALVEGKLPVWEFRRFGSLLDLRSVSAAAERRFRTYKARWVCATSEREKVISRPSHQRLSQVDLG